MRNTRCPAVGGESHLEWPNNDKFARSVLGLRIDPINAPRTNKLSTLFRRALPYKVSIQCIAKCPLN
jgi:hypothetical protein